MYVWKDQTSVCDEKHLLGHHHTMDSRNNPQLTLEVCTFLPLTNPLQKDQYPYIMLKDNMLMACGNDRMHILHYHEVR